MSIDPKEELSESLEDQITANLESKQPPEVSSESSKVLPPDLAELELGSLELEDDEDTELNDIREELAEWNASDIPEKETKNEPVSEINLKVKVDACDQLFLKDLPKLYRKKNSQLEQIFKKDLLINVDRKYYYCSFSANELIVTKENKKAETQVTVSEDVLEKILNSQLNPQIALLNNKVLIEGDFHAGLYFFNLLNV